MNVPLLIFVLMQTLRFIKSAKKKLFLKLVVRQNYPEFLAREESINMFRTSFKVVNNYSLNSEKFPNKKIEKLYDPVPYKNL